MKKSALFLLTFAVILMLIPATPVHAAGVVGTGTPASCTEAALDAALLGGGLVTFSCGSSDHTITISYYKVINTNTTIDGGGVITFNGANANRIFAVAPGVTLTLDSLTLFDGRAMTTMDVGGAILLGDNAALFADSVIFSSNHASTGGGAIFASNALVNIVRSTFTGNSTSNLGGAIAGLGTSITIDNSTFTNNSSNGGQGGAIHFDGSSTGTLTITNSIFDGNNAYNWGGAIDCTNAQLTISNTVFQNNMASGGIGFGGALLLQDSCLTTINGASTSFTKNTADSAGGAILGYGDLTISDASFISNSAADFGGGISVVPPNGKLTVSDAYFTNNTSTSGGGIYHDAPSLLTVIDVAFDSNHANLDTDGGGGAILLANTSSSAAISGSIFMNNTASYAAGAILNSGEPFTVTNSFFTNNSVSSSVHSDIFGGAIGTSANNSSITGSTFTGNSVSGATNNRGGAVFNSGTLEVEQSTFTGNQASTGGAVYNASASLTVMNSTFDSNLSSSVGSGITNNFGTATVVNSTFSGNSNADHSTYYNEWGSATSTLINNTFSGNSSGTGEAGALGNFGGTLHLTNNIFANSTAGANDCHHWGGTIATNLSNLIEQQDGSCGVAAVTSDPNLGPLADNGGPTHTMALIAGSSATNAADAAACAAAPVSGKDQRGVIRPQGAGCDLGAYELDITAPTVTINQASTQSDPTNTSPINFTVVFSEAISGFESGDITLTGSAGATTDTVTEIAPFDGTTYNVTVIGMTSDGTVTASISAAVAKDNANIDNTASTTSDNEVTYDGTAPTLFSFVRVTPATSPTNADTLTFYALFDEPTLNVDTTDFDVTGTTASLSVSMVSVTSYNLTLSGGDLAGLDGVVGINLAAGQNITDLIGNALPAGEPATDETYIVDNTAPTLTAFARHGAAPNPTSDETLYFRVSFDEDVQNVTADDFDVTGSTATITTVIFPTTYYRLTVTGGDLAGYNGEVGINLAAGQKITDLAGNALPAGEPVNDQTWTVDNTAPTVTSINRASSSPTNANSVDFTVTFSESVSDIETGDFVLATSGTSGTIASISAASGTTVTVTVNAVTGDGALGLNFDFDALDSVQDSAGNSVAADFTGQTYTIDNTNPTVSSINRADPTPTNATSVDFTVTFSEAVTDIETSDFVLATSGTSGTIASVSASNGTTITVTVNSITGDGTLRLDFDDDADDSVLDTAGNLSYANFSGQTYTIDNTAPSLTSFSRYGGAPNPNSNDIQYFLATFNEDVANVDTADFDVNGSTATVTDVLQITTTTFRLTVDGGDLASYNGDVGVDLATGQNITDLAGNALPAGEPATDQTWTVDNSNPSVAINQASTQADPTNTSPIYFTVVFSEAMTGFDSSDITVGGTATVSSVGTSTSDNITFTVDIDVTSGGTVIPSIAAGVATDSSGNGNTASTSTDNEVTYDITAPTIPATTIEVNYNLEGPTFFEVTFSEDVFDPAGNTDPDDVSNPANYLLVEAGANTIFDTTACNTGVAPDDVNFPINAVTYDNGPFTATIPFNNGVPLGNGIYRFFICGTTSIVDPAGTPIAGNGQTPGTDHIVSFRVAVPDTLPDTGFAPGVFTSLPAQPADKQYVGTDLMLEVPSLGIKRSIVGVPVVENQWDVTWLGSDVGYLIGTAFPTTEGNTVLTAHVFDNNNYPGPFAELSSLGYGDQIKIHAWGQVYTYEVRTTRLNVADYLGYAFQYDAYDWVTLITCEDYNPLTDSYGRRRIVRAVLVRVE